MRFLTCATAMVFVVALATGAHAASCKIGGITKTCERTCPPDCSPSHADCDNNSDGYCTICGKTGAQFIAPGPGDHWICGKGGDDVILGNSGNDVIDGGGGNDEVYGGDGDDDLFGGSGHDVLNGGIGTDALNGGAGDDDLVDFGTTLAAGGSLCGGEGDDTLSGDAGFGGWFCLDGGDGQSGSGDCSCLTFGSNGKCTARNCAGAVGDLTGAAPCGCSE